MRVKIASFVRKFFRGARAHRESEGRFSSRPNIRWLESRRSGVDSQLSAAVVTFLLLSGLNSIPLAAAAADSPAVPWRQCLRQKPEWYGSAEAVRIGENVLCYQRSSGGWPKNIEMAEPLTDDAKSKLRDERDKIDSTIDNGATTTQLRYLARVFNASKKPQFKDAFLHGLDFLLAAQYPNGGWPQFFPKPRGYSAHITFNDDAMINVLALLREIERRDSVFAFVDEARHQRTQDAIPKGIDCILKCQIIVDGHRLAWCAQHDEATLRPAPARAYEKVSLSGGESVGILRFLMQIEQPGPEVIHAIESAMAWLRQARLAGMRVVEKPDANLPKGYDKVLVADPKAGGLWARFYEIGTNRPIFCGRDGVIRYSLAEIEHERRVGYAWYTEAPARLLEVEFPAWQERIRKATADR